MSAEIAKAKREERARIAKQMTDLAKLVASEERDFTAEETAQFDAWEEMCRSLEATYTRLEKAEAQQAALDAKEENREHQAWVDKKTREINEDVPTSKDYDLAYRGWLMAGYGSIPDHMRAAMNRCNVNPNAREFDLRMPRLPFSGRSLPRDTAAIRAGINQALAEAREQVITRATTSQTVTTTGGGNLVGNDNSLIGQIYSSMLTGGAMRSVATVIQTDSGASLPIPIDDNRDKGTLVGINTAVDTANLTFAQLTMDAYKYGSLVKLPIELIQDSGIDIQAFTGQRIGERLRRITEEHFATGAASLSEPEGIVTTGSSGGAGAGATCSSAANVQVGDLLSMVASIDDAYLGDCQWMMHQGTRANIAAQLDGDGRPLWQPSLQAGQADTLLGYPVVINNEFSAFVGSSNAPAKILTFGRHQDYYIRDVMGVTVRRLDERFAEYAQVGVIGFSRHDGVYVNTAQTNTTNASIKFLAPISS